MVSLMVSTCVRLPGRSWECSHELSVCVATLAMRINDYVG